MNNTNIKKLVAIYEAIGGITSELDDPFAKFYKGGTSKLVKDLESVLKSLGVKICSNSCIEYHVASYSDGNNKLWGICTDVKNPSSSFVLNGIASSEEAVSLIETFACFSNRANEQIRILDVA